MGCNGYGHPSDCNCGWGGQYYGGNGFLLRAYDVTHWQKADSFTNPNAKCPVCGAKVYFYRSSDGGAVFFDDLGRPWPKHPCTDNKRESTAQPAPRLLQLKEPGWFPLLYEMAWPMKDDEGTWLEVSENQALFIKVRPSMFYGRPPVMVKLVDRDIGEYELTTVQKKKGVYKEYTTRAWKLKALLLPRVAKLFPGLVATLNRLAEEDRH